MDRPNWREYNERLVKLGEMYLSLDLLETWAKDLESLNSGKAGAPYEYPECLMTFLGFIHIMLGMDYRGLEGFVRGLRKFAPVAVPGYTTICRRVNALRLEIQETPLEHEDEDVAISLDASGLKVTNRGERIRKKWRVQQGLDQGSPRG